MSETAFLLKVSADVAHVVTHVDKNAKKMFLGFVHWLALTPIPVLSEIISAWKIANSFG